MKFAPLAIDGVSSQNIYDCAKLLLSPTPISRNEAAERLELSSVTVGKVAAAMLDGGLLRAEKRKGAKGRSAELYRAPDSFAVLLILLGKRNFSASLLTLDKTRRTVRSRLVNESLCYEDDAKVFLASLFSLISAPVINGLFSVTVIYEGKSPSSLGVDFRTTLGCEPDIVIERKLALGEYFAKNSADVTSLYVSIDERINYELYSKGSFLSEKAKGHKLDSKDDTAIAFELAKGLATLFEYTVPKEVAISSASVTVDKRFTELVAKILYQKVSFEESDKPVFIDERDMSLVGSFALERSLEIFSKKLAGIL